MSLNLIKAFYVLTLEKRQRQVLYLVLKRDFIADKAVTSADQFREPGLLGFICRAHGRLECHRHTA